MHKNLFTNKKNLGFTLIELLVVIAIISLLSSVVLTKMEQTKQNSRDSVRFQNIKSLQTAIESYYNDNGYYPKTFEPSGGPVTFKECEGHPNDYVPNLVPNYINKLPSDPNLDCNGITHSWVYSSNGIDYKLITHNERQTTSAIINSLIDPAWDGGLDPCVLDGDSRFHYGIWTSGATCWSL